MTRSSTIILQARCFPARCLSGVVALLVAVLPSTATAAAPNVELALKLVPTQRDVQCDRPATGEATRCSLRAIKSGDISGWVVRGPAGKTLRRFVDSNNDNVVDQWCYYQDGIEVYRDIDSDFNRKADQYRWLNTAGSRWGIDRDEDGVIDSWKSISAQEVTAEVVAAAAQRDGKRFSRLLLTSSELRSLGLSDDKAEQVAEKLRTASTSFGKLFAGDAALTRNSKWVHFSASQPGTVPAGTDGLKNDLFVYENVVAMVETDGKPGLIQIGTLVRSGDVWRLIDAPLIPDAGTAAAAGFFFQTELSSEPIAAAATNAVSDEMQKLLTELEELQRRSPPNEAAERTRYHERQAAILEGLVEVTKQKDQRTAWLKQLVDNVGAAVQAGDYPEGVQRLEKLSESLRDAEADDNLIAYAKYRHLLAGYSQAMQEPKADFAAIQAKWLKDLEGFVESHPQAEDAPEAMLQFAMAQEFAGEEEEAKTWYGKTVREYPDQPQAKKAAGAKRRLESVGEVLALKGQDIKGGTVDLARYKGRMVVIQFWATWCEPCKEDMETLTNLVAKYGRQGFSVLGVNVDQERNTALQFMTRSRLSWHNIHEPGGLDSRPAIELGVLTLPTMILVDQQGRVINRSIHVSELEAELKNQLKTAAPTKRNTFR